MVVAWVRRMASPLADYGGTGTESPTATRLDGRSGPNATWYTAEAPMFGRRMRVIAPPRAGCASGLRLESPPRRAYRSLEGPVILVLPAARPVRNALSGWGRKAFPMMLLAGVLTAGCLAAVQAVLVFRASWQSTDTSLYASAPTAHYRSEDGVIPGPFASIESVWKEFKGRFRPGGVTATAVPAAPTQP